MIKRILVIAIVFQNSLEHIASIIHKRRFYKWFSPTLESWPFFYDHSRFDKRVISTHTRKIV